MSNDLAIAAVTTTLRDMLQAALQESVPGAAVTAGRPGGAEQGSGPPGVSLYLYQVTPNTAWRNADLPARDAGGRLLQPPRAALDLHYLLTFRGDEAQLEPQRLLGSAIRALHERPALSRERIASAAGAAGEPPGSVLAAAGGGVTITPLALSLEELSKVWSGLFQTRYELSVAYLASPVLIEGKGTPARALPVRGHRVEARPLHRAVIREVVSASGDEAPIRFGDDILVRGSGLDGEEPRLRVGACEVTPAAVSAGELRATLTDPGLRAGLQPVQVRSAGGWESDAAPLVLRPAIARDAAGRPCIAVEPGDPPLIAVGLVPAAGARQRLRLYLNPTVPGPAYAFGPRPLDADAATVRFEPAGVPPGEYLLRVQVDGAETPLETDAGGRYSAPVVTLP